MDKKTKYPPPFSLRLTHAEREALENAANGKPLSTYIRWLIFKDDLAPMPTKTKARGMASSIDHQQIARLLGALGQSRIASNINQLAKAANSGSLPVNQEVLNALRESVTAIHWMRDTLIKALGLKSQRKPDKDENHDP